MSRIRSAVEAAVEVVAACDWAEQRRPRQKRMVNAAGAT